MKKWVVMLHLHTKFFYIISGVCGILSNIKLKFVRQLYILLTFKCLECGVGKKRNEIKKRNFYENSFHFRHVFFYWPKLFQSKIFPIVQLKCIN